MESSAWQDKAKSYQNHNSNWNRTKALFAHNARGFMNHVKKLTLLFILRSLSLCLYIENININSSIIYIILCSFVFVLRQLVNFGVEFILICMQTPPFEGLNVNLASKRNKGEKSDTSFTTTFPPP